ncbi:MAG: ATP-grasp domain-containing protein, partial [Cohaesibacteraceae bacterium]|nr:ATP-grasp domain-containing protein [Cohaesibacteraceae bacterium]
QVSIQSDTKLEDAFLQLNGAPAILEGFISFSREVSVISARNLEGDISIFDVAENEHRNHILKRTIVPANLDAQTMQEALDIGRKTAEALGYTGVMAVELFVVEEPEGTRLLVNEMAPRVHNSGHWTESACYTSQFEQHIRAICGWPLGSPQRHSNISMENILGDELNAWPLGLTNSSVSLHIYGKTEIRTGRKMGHANFLSKKPVSNS